MSWAVALVGGLSFLHSLGAGWLEPPPLATSGWGAWAEGRDPLVASIAVLRLAVLALGWYLVAVTLVGMMARLARAPRAIRAVDAVTLPGVRRLLSRSLGASMVAAIVVAGPSVTGPRSPAYADPQVQAVDGGDLTHAVVDGPQSLPLPLDLALRRPDDADLEPPRRTQDGDPVTQAVVEQTAVAGTEERAVLVRPGDSLWTIARGALAEQSDGPVDEEQVATYWTRVIERNRADLPDPANPDLIFPGDVIFLPTLEGARTMP